MPQHFMPAKINALKVGSPVLLIEKKKEKKKKKIIVIFVIIVIYYQYTVESRYLEHALSRISRYLELFVWSLEGSR